MKVMHGTVVAIMLSGMLTATAVAVGHGDGVSQGQLATATSGAFVDCKDCPGQTCTSSEHAVEYFGPVDLGVEDPYEGCTFGSCEGHQHEFVMCEGGEDAQELLDALASVDVGEVEGLIASYGAVATYNTDRQALQVVGCAGEIVAHIPMRVAN